MHIILFIIIIYFLLLCCQWKNCEKLINKEKSQ